MLTLLVIVGMLAACGAPAAPAPANGYGIVKNDFMNVPSPIPGSWLYPKPAPTNPEQYWIQQ